MSQKEVGQKRFDVAPGWYEPIPPTRSVDEMRELMPLLVEQVTPLSRPEAQALPEARSIFMDFVAHLELGTIRCAERKEDGTWETNHDARQMIDVGFKLGDIVAMSRDGDILPVYDRDTYPPQQFSDYAARSIRMIATGLARRGSHIGNRVTFMNGAYANVGAVIEDDTMLDTNALPASAAQIGKICHICANAMIAGVLEPKSAEPNIVEDDVFMGAGSMIAEGVVLRRGSALAMGTRLHYSTPLYDVVNEKIIKPQGQRLYVPENALVIPGTHPLTSGFARKHGLAAEAAIIVKYYDPNATMPERRSINYNLR